jgi:hypothetical protein
MNVVYPPHLFRIHLDVGQIEIDNHWLLAAAYVDARQRLIVARIDLLARNVWRHVNEIARFMPGACGVLGLNSFARTTRTPSRRHLDLLASCIAPL